MSAIDECGVLIPAATLEDFPSDLSDSDARSLLAAWTVLWHPRLLAAQGQIPTWYRADSPPDPVGQRILTVPHPSVTQLPERYETQCRQSEGCQWITGNDRQQMLAALDLGDDPPAVEASGRSLCLDDFFAAGYAVLQVQVMTRRLRYTSNLDEIHLQNRIVAAAKAFLDQDGETAVAAMHDVFDCLAEERDHYFSSDPHLIDLILMTETTVDSLLQLGDFSGRLPFAGDGSSGTGLRPDDSQASESSDAADSDSSEQGEQKAGGIGTASNDPSPSVLSTPINVLIDHDVAVAIGKLDRSRSESLRTAISAGTLGWAGGGPADDTSLDLLTFRQAEAVFRQTYRTTEAAIGTPPPVYARFSGSTPSDMTATLVKLGYSGLIPLDFAGGTGFGDEAKVIVREGGVEIESLTAKPIDATSDSAFLPLGAKLGEAIDSGEIATALLAHWPGTACESYHDLRRVASWSLTLGKFWKLDDYFREGEHPYHHGNGRAASPGAAQHLSAQVDGGSDNPISTAAVAFRKAIVQESEAKLVGLTALIKRAPSDTSQQPMEDAFAQSVGRQRGDGKRAMLLVNPHSIGCRDAVEIEGSLSKSSGGKSSHIYGVSSDTATTSVATVDIPACGFAVVQGDNKTSSHGFSFKKLIGLGGPRLIADQHMLRNEFMEVSINEESGALSGVYSGGARGNRFSMRLIRSSGDPKSNSTETKMRANKCRVVASTAALGTIEVEGQIVGGEDQPLASFRLAYTLRRGSRILSVAGELNPIVALGADPWKDYLAARVAVVSEASIFRLLLRDKVHRAHGRRLVSPLGVVLDEAERQTLVACDGLPYHVRAGDRFLDTLLAVRGESEHKFTLRYGFDVSNPVAVAKTLIAPPIQIPVSVAEQGTELGWLIHAAPKDIVMTDLQVGRRDDGRLAAIVRVIQSRSKSCTAVLRFIHDVQQATVVEKFVDDPINLPLEDENSTSALKCKGDQVSLPLVGHQVVDLLVIFAG